VSDDSPSLIIDRAAYMVYMGPSRISFPKKEFELLLLLASNPKKVFKRDDILQHIWGKEYKPKDSRSLDVHIRMLRRKLGESYISTVRGVGYKLEK
jgi:two-component system alkaline phosphatase synthesis response regulator PhoP